MRAQLGVKRTTTRIDQVDVGCVEVTILQADVPRIAERSAQTSEQLPCETGVGVAPNAGAIHVRRAVHVDAGDTDTAASEGLQTIIRPEIEQAVEHKAQCVNFADSIAGGRTKERGDCRIQSKTLSASGDAIEIGSAVACFGFQTESTEVITHGRAEVVVFVVFGTGIAGSTVNIKALIFDDHHAAIALNIPLAFTSQCGRGERGRSHRQANDKIAHSNFPFVFDLRHPRSLSFPQ